MTFRLAAQSLNQLPQSDSFSCALCGVLADPSLISCNNSAWESFTMHFITLKKHQEPPHACLFVFDSQLKENPSGENFPATAWWQWKFWSVEVFSRNRLGNFWTAVLRINAEAGSPNQCCCGKAVLYTLIVCRLSYPARKAQAPWPVWLLPYFFTLSHQRQDCWKERFLNIQCVFWFPPQISSETFLILIRTKQGIIINVHRSLCRVPVIRVRF